MYKFADKLERVSFVGSSVLMTFSSYDAGANEFRTVTVIRVPLGSFLQIYNIFSDFHGQCIANGIGNPGKKAAEPVAEAKPKRRAKRRKTTAEKE